MNDFERELALKMRFKCKESVEISIYNIYNHLANFIFTIECYLIESPFKT